jgi:tellurite resistance protein TerC
MPAPGAVPIWVWAAFVFALLACLCLELLFFQRAPRGVSVKEALGWSILWVLLALAFGGGLLVWRGSADALDFITAYFVEYSLSMDNVAAIALIFVYFGVPAQQQRRVLGWGLFGAIAMRGGAIGVGAALLHTFPWVLYVLGVFLVLTGVRWAFSRQTDVPPGRDLVLTGARKIFRVSEEPNPTRFFIRENGRPALTRLALALLMVETADLLFAVDSIPAVFAVTQNPFLVFTSNCFAVFGLRSLYFVLAGAITRFRYLKTGLAVVLIFVGTKMLLTRWLVVPTGIALLVLAGILGGAVALSLLRPLAKGAR